MEVSFELIEQFVDQDGNPVFQTEIHIEGLSAGTGTGYSKKESQQNAAQMAIKKVRDTVFLSTVHEIKSQRTIAAESTAEAEKKEDIIGEEEKDNLSETDGFSYALTDSRQENAEMETREGSLLSEKEIPQTISVAEPSLQGEKAETDEAGVPQNSLSTNRQTAK